MVIRSKEPPLLAHFSTALSTKRTPLLAGDWHSCSSIDDTLVLELTTVCPLVCGTRRYMTDSNATELTSITVEGTAATIDGAYDDDFVTFFLYFKIIYEIQNNIFRQNRKCHQRSIFAAIQYEEKAIVAWMEDMFLGSIIAFHQSTKGIWKVFYTRRRHFVRPNNLFLAGTVHSADETRSTRVHHGNSPKMAVGIVGVFSKKLPLQYLLIYSQIIMLTQSMHVLCRLLLLEQSFVLALVITWYRV